MEQAPPDEPLTIARVTGCARCGGSHGGVVTRRMVRPFTPVEAGGLTWTHWAPCPTNGDPILIMVTDAALHVLADGTSVFMPGAEVRRG